MQIAKIGKINKPLKALVDVPGSKSYSLRALLISYMAESDFEINGLLASEDVSAMKQCIKGLKNKNVSLNAKDSGLTARFIIALSCITSGTQVISGSKGLSKRPVKDLVSALTSLGAEIKYLQKEGHLPVRISSSNFSSDTVNLSGEISSQYLSALLLVAPCLNNGLTINIVDDLISKPYVDMTIDIMQHFGVSVKNYKYKKFEISPQKYQAKNYTVEGDYSSAGYFFALAALNKSEITVKNLNVKSKQADYNLLNILEKMGAKVIKNDNSITVTGKELKPVNINMENCPDQAMTIAALAAFCEGESKISGIKSLRVKETERIKALENELSKMQIQTSSTDDSLTIHGGKPQPANIDTYKDHRIAMSFSIAATKLDNIKIINPSTVNKTFPGFWNELNKITTVSQEQFEFKNLVIIGMRGTGKSTVGKILAKKLNFDFVDVDDFIETKNQINIKETVKINGWEYFRDLESEAIKYLSSKQNLIISTGGGAILRPANVFELRKNSITFMLKANPEALAKRISRYGKLPSLTDFNSVEEELKHVWNERKKSYYSSCDFIIDSEIASPKSVANQIIAKIEL